MNTRNIKLFDNSGVCHELLVDEEGLQVRQGKLIALIEYEGRIYEPFNRLSTEATFRYCEVGVSRLSDFIVTSSAIDVR